MPLRVEKSDRRLLIWAAVILLPIIVALAMSSGNEEESWIPSTYSADSRGAKAAYLLLQEEGYNVERWERPPQDLPTPDGPTVLVLALPLNGPSRDEKNGLMWFLTRGGAILATSSTASMFLPQAEIKPEPLPSPAWKDYAPQMLSTLTRGGSIQMSPGGYWGHASTGYVVHYADEGRPIVVSYKVGNGQVIWWAAATPLTNAAISESGNLALLLNSLGDRSTHIYWDEYFHGSRRSVASYMQERPVFFGFAQGCVVALALLLTYSRRHGPIQAAGEPSRLSPLEFVETLGGLYRRAHHTHAALEIPYTRFRLMATRQLGLKSGIAAADLAQAIRRRLHYKKDDDLENLLYDIEAALYDPGLTGATALGLAQRLSVHARNLQLTSYGV